MPAKNLTIKSDVFSFGLMLHQYLTGVLPGYDDKFDYPWGQVLDGRELVVKESIFPDELRFMISEMLSKDFEKRPSISLIRDQLKNIRLGISIKSEDDKKTSSPKPVSGGFKLKPMKGFKKMKTEPKVSPSIKIKPMKKK